MLAWWESLDLITQVLYCLTIPASLILVIQTLLTLIGFGDFEAGVNPSDVSGLDLSTDAGFDTANGLSQNAAVDVADTGDGSAPGDYRDLRLFTLQGIVIFLAVFGWTALILYHTTTNLILGMFAGITAGSFAMYGAARLALLMRKLTSSGNISLKNTLGISGKVYIPIEPGQQGKVTLVVQERFIEADAISDAPKTLSFGVLVRVVDIRAGLLVVEEE